MIAKFTLTKIMVFDFYSPFSSYFETIMANSSRSEARWMTTRNFGTAASVIIFLFFVPVAAAQEKIFAGPSSEPLYSEISPRLMTALYPEFRISLETTSGSIQTIESVLEDPKAIGLVQKDILLNYLSTKPEIKNNVEVFGDLSTRCLFGVIREGGWVKSFEDLKRRREEQPIRVDVGDPDGESAASFNAIKASEPDLSFVELENRGGLRALHMVEAGLVDVAFFVEEPSLTSQSVQKVLNTDELEFLPIVSRKLIAPDQEEEFSYRYSRVVVDRSNWIGRDITYETLCTSVVILANTMGDTKFLDSVAYASLSTDFKNNDVGLFDQFETQFDSVKRFLLKTLGSLR
jgi:TRAP-type uncharacterized transport system substrate-binding protein